jgi:hypothetical protein
MPTNYADEVVNIFGPLAPYERRRLGAVLAMPTQDTWGVAHTMIINRDLLTLWEAVVAVDPTFPAQHKPGTRWPRIPDQLTLRRAMRYARTGEK